MLIWPTFIVFVARVQTNQVLRVHCKTCIRGRLSTWFISCSCAEAVWNLKHVRSFIFYLTRTSIF